MSMISAENLSPRDRILGGLWGSLVGDALGVPVEFEDRADVQANPVQDLRASARIASRPERGRMTVP